MPRVRVCVRARASRYLAVELAVGRGKQREEGALWDMKEEREGGREGEGRNQKAPGEREGGEQEGRGESERLAPRVSEGDDRREGEGASGRRRQGGAAVGCRSRQTSG